MAYTPRRKNNQSPIPTINWRNKSNWCWDNPHTKKTKQLDGLVTLYSCKGTPANNNYSYLVLRSTEEMAYFLEEAIWDIREIEPDLSIDWNESVMYNILGKQKNLSCIILSSIESHTFMETLANCLDV